MASDSEKINIKMNAFEKKIHDKIIWRVLQTRESSYNPTQSVEDALALYQMYAPSVTPHITYREDVWCVSGTGYGEHSKLATAISMSLLNDTEDIIAPATSP